MWNKKVWKIAIIGIALIALAGSFFWLGRTFENRVFEDTCADMGGYWQTGDYPVCVIEK